MKASVPQPETAPKRKSEAQNQASVETILQAYKQPQSPLKDAAADGEVKQLVFAGPQFNQAGNHNGNYAGHQYFPGGVMPNTGCGVSNRIRTGGEQLRPGAASKPGTPANMNTYRVGYARRAGLVKDKTTKTASTKMHLINHRLDTGPTQNVASNIFLGTQKTNNPTHLHQVETPVINAVTNHRSQAVAKANYETAMGNAQQLPDTNGANVLYWPNNALPAANAVRPNDLKDAYIDHNNQVARPAVQGGNQQKKKKIANPTGKSLNPNGYNGLRHLWLEYTVTPNYTGAPAHIGGNVLHETNEANNLKKPNQQALKNQRLQNINAFTANFADNAFPGTFDNDVDYYYASYDPNNIYAQENENLTLNADI